MKAVALRAFCEEIRQAGPTPLGEVPGGSRSIMVRTVEKSAELGLSSW